MNNVQTLKGFRDFLPKEARKRQYVINILKGVFESFGFEPLETPVLEYEEVLTGKYGEEGDKLMYRFEDNGKRKVAMRYDQTVPLARVVAQYSNDLPMIFKRYQTQLVWRGENTQKGRFREFLQCDIDTVGANSPTADAEVVAVALDSMKKLGFNNYSMRVNDRRIFQEFNLSVNAIRALDKVDKEGTLPFINQLMSEGYSYEEANKKFKSLVNFNKPTEIESLFSRLTAMGYQEGKNKDFWFDPTLARGLDYYTSFIFELTLESYGNLSVGGGGRYDNLIGMFTPDKKTLPAVGFAFGFDRIIEAMTELSLFNNFYTSKIVIATLGFSNKFKEYALKIAQKLRINNINSETFFLDEFKTQPSLQTDDPDQIVTYFLKYKDRVSASLLKYSLQKGIPYIAILGEEEMAKNLITVKNLQTREQKQLPFDELLKMLQTK